MSTPLVHQNSGMTVSLVRDIVARFMSGPGNDLSMPGAPEPAFGPPLLGFAAGADRLWLDYKKHAGEFHWTPLEAFRIAFPGTRVTADELSVISWILPHSHATRTEQRRESHVPSERWIRARVMGEKITNNGLRKHIVIALAQAGIAALAPTLLGEWRQVESERFVFASNWSERHAAYAAGLGTFGLCDGLITPVGKSVRIGSVIARVKLPVSERLYASHRAYCLFFNSGGRCGKCIKRCPAEAISLKGHDKRLCKNYADNIADPYVYATFGFKGESCGLCQVGVPCAYGIPKTLKKAK